MFEDLVEQAEGRSHPSTQTALTIHAMPWEEGHPWNAVLEQVAEQGMAKWKEDAGYHRCSIAENAMYRLK